MDDSISRQAAIDAFEDTTFTKNEIRRRLSELPSAQPEQRWIPCSERLPESGQKVLCACRAGIYDVFTYLKNERGPWYKDDRHVYMMGFVTHWMPLPELYKEKVEHDG